MADAAASPKHGLVWNISHGHRLIIRISHSAQSLVGVQDDSRYGPPVALIFQQPTPAVVYGPVTTAVPADDGAMRAHRVHHGGY